MDYQELDRSTQKSQIKARERELEQQHLALSLKVVAPNVGEVVNDQQTQFLTMLEEGIVKLRAMRDALDTV